MSVVYSVPESPLVCSSSVPYHYHHTQLSPSPYGSGTMPRKKKPSDGKGDGADDAQKSYTCKCIKYCDGDPTPLSKSSYYRHRLVEKLRRAGKHVADKVRRKRKKDSVGRGARRRGGTQDPAERALGVCYILPVSMSVMLIHDTYRMCTIHRSLSAFRLPSP